MTNHGSMDACSCVCVLPSGFQQRSAVKADPIEKPPYLLLSMAEMKNATKKIGALSTMTLELPCAVVKPASGQGIFDNKNYRYHQELIAWEIFICYI